MNQLENNIDTYFKSQVDTVIIGLDKDKAWDRLDRKRKARSIRYYAMAVAAVVLMVLILLLPDEKHDKNDYAMSDIEKRQKLREFEEKISGTHIETIYCYNCSWEVLRSQTRKDSRNYIKLDVY